MALPALVNYGTVTGTFVRGVSVAPNRGPVSVPIEGAVIVFTPSISPAIVRVVGSSPPMTILIEPVTATTDADGSLIGADGGIGVKLVASQDADIQPNGWTYVVTLEAMGYPVLTFPFSMPVDGAVDLTTVAPQAESVGAEVEAWQIAVNTVTSLATAAADSATLARQHRTAVEAIPTTTDGIITGLDADATSTFRVQSDARQAATFAPLVFFAPPRPIVPTSTPVTIQWTSNGTSGGAAPVSGAADPSALWQAPAGYTVIEMHAETTPQAWFSHGTAKAISKGGYPLIGNETVLIGYQSATWGLGFTTNATTIEVTGYIANQVNQRQRPMVLIDGMPTTFDFPADLVTGSTVFAVLTLQFPDVRSRRIEILHNWMVGTIRYNTSATVMAPWNRGDNAPSVYIEGDSWVQGTTQTLPLPSWPHALMLNTSWHIGVGGIGGTGYTSGATDYLFDSAARLAAIVAFAPDIVLIAGTINDNASPAAAATAAKAHWAAIKAALPNALIVVFGPQQVPGYEAAAEANRAAISAAAAASVNVDYYRDSIAEGWSTNAWITGPDVIHPSRLGAYVYADIATTALRLAAQVNGDNRW